MRQKNEYDFVVTLKHPDYKIYNVITVLICVITVAAEVFALLNLVFSAFTGLNIFLIAVIVLSLMIAFINHNKKENITTFKWALYACCFFMVVISSCIFR